MAAKRTPKPLALALLCSTLILLQAATIKGGGAIDGAGELSWLISATDLLDTAEMSTCKGTIAECVAEEEEFEMVGGDSESNRRNLGWRRRYISYGALRRNYIPCSHRGRSYYNCRSRGRANPYRRGCSRITRCRG